MINFHFDHRRFRSPKVPGIQARFSSGIRDSYSAFCAGREGNTPITKEKHPGDDLQDETEPCANRADTEEITKRPAGGAKKFDAGRKSG